MRGQYCGHGKTLDPCLRKGGQEVAIFDEVVSPLLFPVSAPYAPKGAIYCSTQDVAMLKDAIALYQNRPTHSEKQILELRKLIKKVQYGTRYSLHLFINEIFKIIGEEA